MSSLLLLRKLLLACPRIAAFSELKKTTIEHCNDQFRHHVPTEVECLRAFCSKKLLGHMGRCFGAVDRTLLSAAANDALLKCVLGERMHSIRQVDQSSSDVLASFAKAGVLKIDAQILCFLFYFGFTDCYFPVRADSDPATLREFVMKAIQSMSATSLASSTSSPDDFPTETTFQHLFTLGLLQNKTFDTELSRSFATSTTVKGEIDFFVDGDRMWGIEFVRSGTKIGEHLSRFGPGGKRWLAIE